MSSLPDGFTEGEAQSGATALVAAPLNACEPVASGERRDNVFRKDFR